MRTEARRGQKGVFVMNARKEFNRTVAKAAREAGAYALVMGNWDRLDRSLPAEKAVQALVVLLDPSEPAKAPKAAPKAAKAQKAADPGPAMVDFTLTLTPAKVRAAIERGLERPSKDSDETFTVEVTIDGRFRAAKVLKGCGFTLADGKASIRVSDGKETACNVVEELAHLFRDCGLWNKAEGARSIRVVA